MGGYVKAIKNLFSHIIKARSKVNNTATDAWCMHVSPLITSKAGDKSLLKQPISPLVARLGPHVHACTPTHTRYIITRIHVHTHTGEVHRKKELASLACDEE